jgi:hypothetical protein
MSITDKEWIVIGDELDDAQSVLSVSRSDGEAVTTESDETSSMPHLSEPLKLNSPITIGQNFATYGWSPDLVTRSAAQLMHWMTSLLNVSGTPGDLDLALLRNVNQSTTRIHDHKGCISPYLGRIASSQLRACGFIGSLYVPNVEALIDAEKLAQRAIWTGSLKC